MNGGWPPILHQNQDGSVSGYVPPGVRSEYKPEYPLFPGNTPYSQCTTPFPNMYQSSMSPMNPGWSSMASQQHDPFSMMSPSHVQPNIKTELPSGFGSSQYAQCTGPFQYTPSPNMYQPSTSDMNMLWPRISHQNHEHTFPSHSASLIQPGHMRTDIKSELLQSCSGYSLPQNTLPSSFPKLLTATKREMDDNSPDSSCGKRMCRVTDTHRVKPEFSFSLGPHVDTMKPLPEQFLAIEFNLAGSLLALEYGEKVSHIYNPLEYAIEPHSNYVHKFCTTRKSVMFLGMNPGPYGMAQTGVPFGETNIVKDWLKLTGHVTTPEKEHPKRPIWGLDCPRSEVSGARFWGLLRDKCGTPENFFQHCFVHNMCPLVFMSPNGKNLTPPDLPVAARRPMNELCDQALCRVLVLLGIRTVVGIGKFAEQRTLEALKNSGLEGIQVFSIMHPSPANPAANKGWSATAERQLQDIGVLPILIANNHIASNENVDNDDQSQPHSETQGLTPNPDPNPSTPAPPNPQ